MRILIVSDAWAPQVNGVVRTLQTTVEHLREAGDDVDVVEPGAPIATPSQVPLAEPEPCVS